MGSPFTICKDGDGKTQVAVGGHGLGAFTALAVANGHTMPAKLREDFPVLVNAPDFAADTRFKVVVASSPRTLDFNGYALFNSEQGSSGKTTIPDLEGKGVKTLVLGALLDTTSSIANNVDPITNTIQCEVEPDPVNGRPKQKSGRTKQTFRADYKFAGPYVLLGPAAFFWAWLNLSVRFSFVSPVSPGHSGFIDHCPLHEQLENHIVQEGYRIFNYAHLPGLEKLDATSVCLGLLSRDPDDVIGAGHKEGATQLFIPLCNEYWTSLRTAAEAGCLGHKHDAVCGIFEGIAANEQLRLLRDDPICSLATGHPLTGDRGAVIDYTQYACSIRSKLMPYIDRFQCVTSPIGYISALHFQVRTTVAHIHETIYGDDKCFDWSLMDDTLVQLDQGVDEGNLFLREKAAGYCFDGPMCYPNKQNGSDDCKEGDRVPEQFRSDEGNCARCMTYTAQYLTPVPNSHGYYENPDFCDGRGGERVRCHSKRDHVRMKMEGESVLMDSATHTETRIPQAVTQSVRQTPIAQKPCVLAVKEGAMMVMTNFASVGNNLKLA
ncbi:hypothetical protein THAOC_23605 [Thalassiosira oceanica]|uniref:Uncharacterized protein n=1 Tax=Thalassiosira oceanica TaxID=159749 RepID=K0SCR2_THAOC|nr:hypothetical protein THAOC_23605 [Thalassiosira oceanica]|eukprot:EJK56497.1 hypothetical protein THAOC_23605 [Thalassiosira oceanica]